MVALVVTLVILGLTASDGFTSDEPRTGGKPATLNWDVYLTGATGETITEVPVEGLQLFVDGQLTEILELQGPQGDTATGPPYRLVLAIDDGNLSRLARRTLLAQLQVLVERCVAAGAEVMLVSFDGSLQIRQPFTTDAGMVKAVLDELAQRREPGLADLKTELDREIARLASAPDNEERTSSAVDLLQRIRDHRDVAEQYMEGALAALERVSRALCGVPERKVLVYVGDGLESDPAADLVQRWRQQFPRAAFVAGLTDETPVVNGEPVLFGLVQYATAHRISYFPIHSQPPVRGGGGGGWVPEDGAASLAEMVWFDRDTSLAALAFGTGGRVIEFTRQLAGDLEELAAELDSVTTLQFRTGLFYDNEYRTVELRAVDEAMRIRQAAGFPDASPEVQTVDRTLSAALFGTSGGPFEVTIDPGGQHPGGSGQFIVPVSIKVALGRLMVRPDGGWHEGKVSIVVASCSGAGDFGETHGRRYPLRFSNDELLEAVHRPLAFSERLTLAAGEQRIAVTVRDELAAREATAVFDLVVGGGEM